MKKFKQICTTLCFLFLCNAVMSSMTASAPQITQRPSEKVKCEQFGKVNFELSVQGIPIPELRIYKDGKEIVEPNSLPYSLYSTGTGKFIFRINYVLLSHAGTYKFEFTNENGTKSVSAELTVEEI